jgi:mRNA deadenylase 3'-5' endonuclease subunit Ccr4
MEQHDAAHVTFLQWNVLAQCYLLHSPPTHLQPKEYARDKRRSLTAQALREARADVVCLQELDDYDTHWSNAFGKLGYRSVWDCRTSKREGLCMLYKEDTVRLVSIKRVELDDVVLELGEEAGGHHRRHSLAQLALFECLENGAEFLAVNTHLFWNPAATDVKVFQAYFLATQIHRFLDKRRHLPVILCGDFNSLPKSAVLQLLLTGRLDAEHPEYRQYCAARYPHFDFSVPIRFQNEPCGHFTNYVGHFKGCIDYCLFRGCALVEQRVVGGDGEEQYCLCDKEDFEMHPEAPPEGAASVYPLLPSRTWPSDHLALLATFSLSKKQAF